MGCCWPGQPAGNQPPTPGESPTYTGLVSPCPCSPWILGSDSLKWFACGCAGSMLVSNQASSIQGKTSGPFSKALQGPHGMGPTVRRVAKSPSFQFRKPRAADALNVYWARRKPPQHWPFHTVRGPFLALARNFVSGDIFFFFLPQANKKEFETMYFFLK